MDSRDFEVRTLQIGGNLDQFDWMDNVGMGGRRKSVFEYYLHDTVTLEC
jgi:hypothetical protein